jgi:hypothetical protein
MIFRDLPCKNPQLRGYLEDMYELQAAGEDPSEVLDLITDHLPLIQQAKHVLASVRGTPGVYPRDLMAN